MKAYGRTVLSLLVLASLLLLFSGAGAFLSAAEADGRRACCETDHPSDPPPSAEPFCASGDCLCSACASVDLSLTAIRDSLPEHAEILAPPPSRYLLPDYVRPIDNPPRVA